VPVPKSWMLKEVAATLFYLYDVNNTKSLELKEIATWLETCKEFVTFLQKYEPRTKILENKSLFAEFPATDMEHFCKDVLRANQISTVNRINSDMPAAVKKPRRVKKIKPDLYVTNDAQLKIAKSLVCKVEKFINRKTVTPVSQNIMPTTPQTSLFRLSKIGYFEKNTNYDNFPSIIPCSTVKNSFNNNILKKNTVKSCMISPRIFTKSTLNLETEKTAINMETIPYNCFKGIDNFSAGAESVINEWIPRKNLEDEKMRRSFKLNKFVPRIFGKQVVKEIPKNIAEHWKNAYQILNSVQEFNLHMYLSILKSNPKLKNIFDKYLELKQMNPNISGIF